MNADGPPRPTRKADCRYGADRKRVTFSIHRQPSRQGRSGHAGPRNRHPARDSHRILAALNSRSLIRSDPVTRASLGSGSWSLRERVVVGRPWSVASAELRRLRDMTGRRPISFSRIGTCFLPLRGAHSRRSALARALKPCIALARASHPRPSECSAGTDDPERRAVSPTGRSPIPPSSSLNSPSSGRGDTQSTKRSRGRAA